MSNLRVAALYVPNLVWLGFLCFGLTVQASGVDIRPPIIADRVTLREMNDLEREIAEHPDHADSVVKLAGLFSRAGALEWAFDILSRAATLGPSDSNFRLRIAMGFVELGDNERAKDLLQALFARCRYGDCSANLRARISIYSEVIVRLIQKHINARTNPHAAEDILGSVVKQVDAKGLLTRTPQEKPHIKAPPQPHRDRRSR